MREERECCGTLRRVSQSTRLVTRVRSEKQQGTAAVQDAVAPEDAPRITGAVVFPASFHEMLRHRNSQEFCHLRLRKVPLLASPLEDLPLAARATRYIAEHQDEDISLTDVSKSVNASTFYFCKMFKKATGINFTEYLSRVRVEKAKNLLLNPNARVSEVAYQVGFRSLTHFNRVFRKLTGHSPTEYRRRNPL